jgi:RimJ/RimL family protein N-acetyltransferase
VIPAFLARITTGNTPIRSGGTLVDVAGMPERIEVGVDGLVLRRLRVDDVDRMLAAQVASRPELRQWMPWAVEPPTSESVLEFVQGEGARSGFGLFDPDGEFVGGFGLPDRRGPGILEIGYWVRTDRTGRGYATAAARVLTQVAFSCFPDVDRLEIRTDLANRLSAAIPPKLGYRLDVEVDSEVRAEAETGRQQVWAITRAEWERTRERELAGD